MVIVYHNYFNYLLAKHTLANKNVILTIELKF